MSAKVYFCVLTEMSPNGIIISMEMGISGMSVKVHFRGLFSCHNGLCGSVPSFICFT